MLFEKTSHMHQGTVVRKPLYAKPAAGARFAKAPETFRVAARKAIAKSQTLRLQNCFIYKFLVWREVPFIQEVSGVYTFPFLDTDGLKMAGLYGPEKFPELLRNWSLGPVSRRSRKVFAPGKPVAKSQILWLQSCFFHLFLIRTEFPSCKKFQACTPLCL